MKKKNKLSIGILGLWHLGCTYLTSLASAEFDVFGYDEDKKIVANLKKGILPILEPNLETYLKKYNTNISFCFEVKDLIKDKAYIFITYDVPVNNHDIVQTGIISKTFKILTHYISSETIIVISSQVPIGTSRKLVNLLKGKGIENPKVIYFPENLRLGNAFMSFMNPDRIILGSDNLGALNKFMKDFSFLKCPIITMGLESAEMAKHALNCYLATCISFSSEISDLSEKTGANMLDVIKALKTDKRVSIYAPINPGLGFAGGTLGRDIQSLRKIAKDKKYKSKLLETVYSVNQDRLSVLIDKIYSIYPSLKKKNIGLLGLTYKPNTDTLRRSISLELSAQLKKRGGNVKAFDPSIKTNVKSHPYITICSSLEDFLKDLDLAILMTEWPLFLERSIPKLSYLMKNKVIIDTKNFIDANLYKESGYIYLGMGVG
ncbi:UDP-glucose/GDP-mannose dehydrogenase family protein [Candidatus Daviesbacteria bacterium]|nr:UDP-glucose/GDP-mannose dehydrogenase family protein [Candidatus Daviesbacteria bacterium]